MVMLQVVQNNALSQLIVNRIMELRDVEAEGARSNIFRSENTALRVPPPPSLESLEHALVEHRRNATPREEDALRVEEAGNDNRSPRVRHGERDRDALSYNQRYDRAQGASSSYALMQTYFTLHLLASVT